MRASAPARPRRLAYFGNPDAAVAPLVALYEASETLGLEVVMVITAEDRRRSRGGKPSPTPVGAAAIELGLPIAHELVDAVDSGADLGVVVAYGHIIPISILERLPMLNLHFSLLPRWRGAAPVERALLAGDPWTGVCLIDVAEALDCGDVRGRAQTSIGADETADDLRDRLSKLGAKLLVEELAKGLSEGEAQKGQPIWAHKITMDELLLDWSHPAHDLHRVVRVGGARTTFRGKPLKVWRAVPCGTSDSTAIPGKLVGDVVETGAGGLRILEVQSPNRNRITFPAWAAGTRPVDGEGFGS